MNDDARAQAESVGPGEPASQDLHDEARPELAHEPQAGTWPLVVGSVALIAIGAVLGAIGFGKLSDATDDRERRDAVLARAIASEVEAEGLAATASANEAERSRLVEQRDDLDRQAGALGIEADQIRDRVERQHSLAAERDSESEEATAAALEVDGLLALLYGGLEDLVRSANGLTIVLRDAADRANHRDVDGMTEILDQRRDERLGALATASGLALSRYSDLLSVLGDLGYVGLSRTLWTDDFSDAGSGWTQATDQDGAARYGNGVYEITATAGEFVVASGPEAAGDIDMNVAVSIDPSASGNSLVGVGCRFSGDGRSGYLFTVDGSGHHQIGILTDGVYEVLADGEGGPVGLSEPLSMTVTCHDDELSMVVDGEVSAKAVDATYLYGDVALLVVAGQAETSAVFDDVAASTPELEAVEP